MVRTSSPKEVPEYVRSLQRDVISRTGYPLLVREEAGIGYDSLLAMAGRTQPFHSLTYVPHYRPYAVHFIVNSAFKILRMWELPPEDRMLPTSTQRRLPIKLHRQLARKLSHPPAEVLEAMSQFLFAGMLRQLTSMPLDIRVERAIADALPAHKSRQHAYLERQLKDLEPHFSPRIAEVSPRDLYAASTAMNVVLAQEAVEIAGVEPGPQFASTPYRDLGERLRTLLRSVKERGYRGDRVATDTWAEELAMRDWYEWTRLDRVR